MQHLIHVTKRAAVLTGLLPMDTTGKATLRSDIQVVQEKGLSITLDPATYEVFLRNVEVVDGMHRATPGNFGMPIKIDEYENFAQLYYEGTLGHITVRKAIEIEKPEFRVIPDSVEFEFKASKKAHRNIRMSKTKNYRKAHPEYSGRTHGTFKTPKRTHIDPTIYTDKIMPLYAEYNTRFPVSPIAEVQVGAIANEVAYTTGYRD